MFRMERLIKTGVVFIGLYCMLLSAVFGQKIRIMPVGDSITKGATSLDNTGFRRYLFTLLTGNGFNVSFVGSQALGYPTDFDRSFEAYSGWYADNDPDTSQNRNIATHIYGWLKKNPADLLLIHIGTNDIDAGASSDQVVINVIHILDEVDRYEADNSRSVPVVLCQIINRADILTNSPASRVTSDFNKKLKVMVDNRLKTHFPDKIFLVNLESGAGLNYNIDFQRPFAMGDMSDNLHPNDKGFKKIALTIYKSLRNIIKREVSPALKPVSPADDSINAPMNLALNWKNANNAATYRVQVAKDSIFENINMDRQNLTDTSALVSNLSDTTIYYWRVIGVNSGGINVAYSSFSGFKTAINKISAPKLLFPENKSVNLQTKLTILWTSSFDVASYTFQLSSDSGFSIIILSKSGIRDTLIQLSNLNPGTMYFWRIIAKGYSGSEITSEMHSFITLMNPPQNLVAVEDSTKKVKISWQYSENNLIGFIIERQGNKNIGYQVIDTLKSNSTNYTDNNTNVNSSYSYRIKAYNKYTESVYSNEATLLVTSVSESAMIDKFYLYQNYPNPFNPSTVIKYQLPEFSHVELKVYDILGREIATLVNADQNTGRYEVKFSAESLVQSTGGSDLPSGIYIYQLKTKTYNETRKMLLVK